MTLNIADKNTVEVVARTFAAILATYLTANERGEVIRRNRENKGTEYENCCASGDFCDSNMAMEEAFNSFGVEVDAQNEAFCTLWGSAWQLAKDNDFWWFNS